MHAVMSMYARGWHFGGFGCSVVEGCWFKFRVEASIYMVRFHWRVCEGEGCAAWALTRVTCALSVGSSQSVANRSLKSKQSRAALHSPSHALRADTRTCGFDFSRLF